MELERDVELIVSLSCLAIVILLISFSATLGKIRSQLSEVNDNIKGVRRDMDRQR